MSNNTKLKLLFFGYANESLPYSRIGRVFMSKNEEKSDAFQVFCFKPKNNNDSSICGCPLETNSKGLNYMIFSFFSFFYVVFQALKDKSNLFIVPSTPPIILGSAVTLAKLITFGRVKWAYHVQDIHPDVSYVNREYSFFAMFLKKIDIINLRSSDIVITLSKDMRDILINRDCSLAEKIFILNNPSLVKEKSSGKLVEVEQDRKLGKIICVFSGNIGAFQDVERVVKHFLYSCNDKLVLYIVGDGVRLAFIQDLVRRSPNSHRIKFLGQFTHSEADAIVSKCDYGIVSLISGISSLVYPSKVAAYASLGVPILSFLEPKSHIAFDISNAGLGIQMYAGEGIDDLDSAALKILDNLSTDFDRERIQLAGESLFGANLLASKFNDLMRGQYEN